MRDLHRRVGRLHGRPAHRAGSAQAQRRLVRGDARDGVVGREGVTATLRRVRTQPRRANPLQIQLRGRTGNLRAYRTGDHGEAAGHSGDAFHRRGTRDAHGPARHPGRRRPRVHRAGRGERQRRPDHPERARERGARRGHVVHGPARRPHTRPRATRRDQGRPRVRRHRHRPRDGAGLAGRRWNEESSGRRREGVHRARRSRDQHRDDRHLPDQDLLRHPRGRRRDGGQAARGRVRPDDGAGS